MLPDNWMGQFKDWVPLWIAGQDDSWEELATGLGRIKLRSGRPTSRYLGLRRRSRALLSGTVATQWRQRLRDEFGLTPSRLSDPLAAAADELLRGRVLRYLVKDFESWVGLVRDAMDRPERQVGASLAWHWMFTVAVDFADRESWRWACVNLPLFYVQILNPAGPWNEFFRMRFLSLLNCATAVWFLVDQMQPVTCHRLSDTFRYSNTAGFVRRYRSNLDYTEMEQNYDI